MTRPRDIADGINRIDTSAADATAITIDANENVGIGTSSPATYGVDNAEDLVIGQGDGNHGITISSFNTSNGTLAFSDTTNATVGRGFVDYDHNVDAMSFGTLSTERLRVDASGRVLTGKTASNFATTGVELHGDGTGIFTKSSSTPLTINRTTNDGGLVAFYKDGTTVGSIGTLSGHLSVGNGDTGILFQDAANNIQPLNLTTNADRDNAIDIGDSANRFKDLYLGGRARAGGSTGSPAFSHHTDTDTGMNPDGSGNIQFTTQGSERMRIDSSGNLLVGTTVTNPTGNATGVSIASNGQVYFSTTQTTSFFHNLFYNGNGLVGSIVTSGSSTSYNTSSDYRLKENIVDAPSSSADIDAIQVRSFDWKVDGSHQKYGMIAQELLTVAPEAVSQPEDPEEMMGVDYSKLVPMMIKEIQQLRTRISQLESK